MRIILRYRQNRLLSKSQTNEDLKGGLCTSDWNQGREYVEPFPQAPKGRSSGLGHRGEFGNHAERGDHAHFEIDWRLHRGRECGAHRRGNSPVVKDHRKSLRTQCRLSCRIRRGRDQIRARVLDVSDGGLCVLSPVELKKTQSLQIEIDIPGQGTARIEAWVWHVRSAKNPSTRRQTWSAGMVLVKSDDTYARLLPPAELNVSVKDDSSEKLDELQVFRVRVQMTGKPRTRLLTLAAATREEAHELAVADLDDSWTIIEVLSV